MSDYTQKNLQEVDNAGADRAPGFEARFARKHIESDHLGISFFRYPPSFKTPFGHHHREQEEAYVIVEGSGRMRLGEEIIDLRQWDVVRVAPEVVRGFESGPEGMAYIAIGNDRPEGGDGVLVEEFWTD